MTLADQRADRSRGTSLARQRAPVVAIGKAVGSPHRVPQPVRMQELLERVRSTDVIILDARPTAEYHAGHIAGAISVPIDELQNRLRTLPAGREYVAYCRGPYCAYADRAVELLRQSRRRAQRLLKDFRSGVRRATPSPEETSERPLPGADACGVARQLPVRQLRRVGGSRSRSH